VSKLRVRYRHKAAFGPKRFAITKSPLFKTRATIFAREALARAKRGLSVPQKRVVHDWVDVSHMQVDFKVIPVAQAAVTDISNVNFTDFADPVD